ncbi:unnamed protein product [Ambrosiozyma monospora]|uniref:Unnamed protein product n=1 Tax=Ambrosiozyma monospora TaxID=43982 RepID=A0ACB5TDT1_AMBMO|nr:unnamed protein product [Ambrosiozyma monospora]
MEDNLIVNVEYLPPNSTPFITTPDTKRFCVKGRIEIRSLTEFCKFQLKSVAIGTTVEQYYKIESEVKTKRKKYINDRFPNADQVKLVKIYDDPMITIPDQSQIEAGGKNKKKNSKITDIDFGPETSKIKDSNILDTDEDGWFIGVDLEFMKFLNVDMICGDHFMKYPGEGTSPTICTTESINELVIGVEFIVDQKKKAYINRRYVFRLPISIVDAIRLNSRQLKMNEELNNNLRIDLLWNELILQDTDNELKMRFASSYANTWKLNTMTLQLVKMVKFSNIGEAMRNIVLMNITKNYNDLVINTNSTMSIGFNLSKVLKNQLQNVKITPSSNQEVKLMIDTIIQERTNK